MAADRLFWKIVLDFIVLVCVAFPLLALLLWIEPYERGYFVDDLSLRLPYKEQQVSIGVLAGVGFAFMIATILVVEIVRDKQGKTAGEKFLGSTLVAGWIWESYNTIGVFVFGAACQQLTSDLAKPVIGRLRPHFFSVCAPLPLDNEQLYIQQYQCTNNLDNPALLRDMRLSFPSSHASFSMYCAVFFVLYIQVKGKWRGSKLLRHGMQFVVILAAWYVGLSRVVDHMHHWGDVAVGFAIGATYALLVFHFVLKPKKYSVLPTQWEDPAPTNILPRVGLPR
ncbi:unnamed protein product [Arctia plantaginis]|uniref:Phosphatidic acid phosphatase type 2/haloperoxidase domain-containing protein n=1 Tax=Arctia plantaginis TaxID=874455 RepID=A0A8S1AAI1_ARCPL|nr:unnamed protein product [Arctia plantaginis]CAB3251097.1 unnamed protein product [Arctia plantaginis]